MEDIRSFVRKTVDSVTTSLSIIMLVGVNIVVFFSILAICILLLVSIFKG